MSTRASPTLTTSDPSIGVRWITCAVHFMRVREVRAMAISLIIMPGSRVASDAGSDREKPPPERSRTFRFMVRCDTGCVNTAFGHGSSS